MFPRKVPMVYINKLLSVGMLALAGCNTVSAGTGGFPGPDIAATRPTFAIQAEVVDGCSVDRDADCSTNKHGEWNIQAVGSDRLPPGANAGTTKIVVGTIDTGVDPAHPELRGLLEPMIDVVGDDDYGSGSERKSYAGVDGNGHGTHVAGIIAAVGRMANLRILPVKAIGNSGVGDDTMIAKGVRSAVDWRDPGDSSIRIKILNLSIGGKNFSRLLQDAIRYAAERDIMIIGSSGNRGRGVDFPASMPEIVAVGATNYRDEIAEYSNRGPELLLTAPGGDADQAIQSTWPTYLTATDLRRGIGKPHSSGDMMGTSMAAPHVSAAVALLLAQDPSLSPRQLLDRLTASANDLGPLGPDPYFGVGLLAVKQALLMWGNDLY
ncbi:MAG: S8 family serine peptidase [Cyanobacteria bacterium NC_groundwater_1444_Ag_S-0.65um_54_12]|nr:S8 family serine peptidase [Cyanobacteria bacterium NC_groundwater_1444_Ag_S-0.65um_54_12]